jgi:hypothetical protein
MATREEVDAVLARFSRGASPRESAPLANGRQYYGPGEEPPLHRVEDAPPINGGGGNNPAMEDQTALPNVDGAISLGDIYAYMPTHSFIYVPSREM